MSLQYTNVVSNSEPTKKFYQSNEKFEYEDRLHTFKEFEMKMKNFSMDLPMAFSDTTSLTPTVGKKTFISFLFHLNFTKLCFLFAQIFHLIKVS
jgi:hypothetical protein